MPLTQADVHVLAPTGAVRAAINAGNAVLVQQDAATGAVSGIAVDLAHAFAAHLGVPLEMTVFGAARDSVAAVKSGAVDFGFFAVQPERAVDIAFSAPYIAIEGTYLVRADSPVQAIADVDQTGCAVVVGRGSAYDLFLSRTLEHASLLRAPTSQDVVATFLRENAPVAAGVRQQLERDAAQHAGLRLLPGHFMLIEQAMGVARSRGDGAAKVLTDFVATALQSGQIAAILARHAAAAR